MTLGGGPPGDPNGEKTALLLEFAQFLHTLPAEDGFAIARTRAPRTVVGKPLRDSLVRTRHKVTVVGVKRAGQDFVYAVPETVVEAGDELIVSGRTTEVDAFCRMR